ncbi:predicted protein [Postia placenta Mad-698-R]|nr:predicted protein [Postia placenta Mad-698-R]
MLSKGLALLAWVFFVHLAGIYLYTRGFLLTRLSLSDTTSCDDGSCTLKATHRRAVLLVIDALRFDFVTPDSPSPPSPHHHGVLTLPQELTAMQPAQSFLFDSFADPPTTTLQRIKGITTGSLPTFIDMGSNFGGASVVEDSLISQLRSAGKSIAFMGDDTWTTVFSDAFASDMCFPYDSFNVEDLHTVDEGVIRHLFPLMNNASAPWDVIIGHFLGVDHVGHRVGPDHLKMRAKLAQMDEVLRRTIEALEEDTLLVVLGDHGMDRRGDHGGDGTVIPELFSHETFDRALELNAEQVKRYLDTYRATAHGGELDNAWTKLHWHWTSIKTAEDLEGRWEAMGAFTRTALDACRILWAQFNVTHIGLGLILQVMGIIAGFALYLKFGELKDDWVDWAGNVKQGCVRGMAIGAVSGLVCSVPLKHFVKGIDTLDYVLFAAPLIMLANAS